MRRGRRESEAGRAREPAGLGVLTCLGPPLRRPQFPCVRNGLTTSSPPHREKAAGVFRLSASTETTRENRVSQGCRRWGLPCPCRRLSTGLGAAARDRVPSASRGRREAAGRALRPLPPGRRHLAASAWRGGGGGAAGLRPPAPPPAGHF